MRICVLTPTFLPTIGGIETSVDNMCRVLQSLGHEVCVVAQRSRDGKHALNLPYPVIRYRRPWSSLLGLGGLQRLLTRLHQQKPLDVLHAMVAHPTGCAALRFHRSTGVPIVVTPRGHDIWETSWYRQRPAVWKRIQQTLRQSPMVSAIGRHMAHLIFELTGGRQVPVVNNGISLSMFARRVSPSKELTAQGIGRRPYLLGLGRLVEQKGLDVLVRAFARIASEVPEHDLVIAGDGPLRDELKHLARQLGIADRVHLPGMVLGDDKLYLLQNCRLTAVPSHYEGYCNVVLEAMACGRPVVATRIPSLTEVVRDGYNGTLADAGDAASLADAIRRTLSPQVLSELRDGIASTAAAHNWPAICEQYLGLYEQAARVAARPEIPRQLRAFTSIQHLRAAWQDAICS